MHSLRTKQAGQELGIFVAGTEVQGASAFSSGILQVLRRSVIFASEPGLGNLSHLCIGN